MSYNDIDNLIEGIEGAGLALLRNPDHLKLWNAEHGTNYKIEQFEAILKRCESNYHKHRVIDVTDYFRHLNDKEED